MKRCSRCKQKRALMEFGRDRSRHDGLEHNCKGCKAEMAAARYARKREAILAQQRASRQESYPRRAEEIRRQVNERYAADPERHRERKRRSYDPVKQAARNAVRTAIERGELERQPCGCGAEYAEAHHDDYDKPLEVRWLCPRCHRQHHAKEID
jgi:ribosomal protein S27AE